VVDAELEALPVDLRARLVRIAGLIEVAGFEGLPHGTIKHLEGKLWEIRLAAQSGIARAIYVTVTGRRVVIVRVFVKKTQKTPPRDLAVARLRAKEVL
jgi:phage-related protein